MEMVNQDLFDQFFNDCDRKHDKTEIDDHRDKFRNDRIMAEQNVIEEFD